MPSYSYKAIDQTGKKVDGNMDASDKSDLFAKMKAKKLTPIKVEEKQSKAIATKAKNATKNKAKTEKKAKANSAKKDKSLAQKDIIPQQIKSKDYAVMCRQAHTMLSAGMNIIATLQVLSVQIENERLREHVGLVALDLQKGYPLSTSLKLYPKVFPSLFISLVESGELTGNLDGVLESLAKYYEREDEIQRRIFSATIYPIVIGIVTVIIVLALMVFVVPIFIDMFEQAGSELPKMTQMLVSISNFCIANIVQIIVFFILMAFLFVEIKKHEKSKYVYDRFIQKLPKIGKSVAKITTARFSRTAATLLESGIPIIQAIKSAAQVSGNTIVIRGVDEISDDIRSGRSLSFMLGTLNYFPPMMISMISIGEESGDMVGLLEKTAEYYEAEMEHEIDMLSGLIEPFMIVTLAIVVGFIVISIMLAVLGLYQTVPTT